MEWKRVDKDPPKTEGAYWVLVCYCDVFNVMHDVYNGRYWKTMIDNPEKAVVTHWLSCDPPYDEAREMVKNKDVQTLW